MKSKKNTIGVLGGMGPQASSEFYRILIEKSGSVYEAKNNDDFPEIVLDSLPVPDFISTIKNLETAKKMLLKRVKRLNSFGATVLCMPCNTAHLLYSDLVAVSKVPFISMVEEVKQVVEKRKLTRVGLLSSTTTRDTGVYSRLSDLVTLTDKDQAKIEKIIRGVLAGENKAELQSEIKEIAEQFVAEKNLDGVILGCTELPLIFPKEFSVPVFNSLEILAESVLAFSFQEGEIYDSI